MLLRTFLNETIVRIFRFFRFYENGNRDNSQLESEKGVEIDCTAYVAVLRVVHFGYSRPLVQLTIIVISVFSENGKTEKVERKTASFRTCDVWTLFPTRLVYCATHEQHAQPTVLYRTLYLDKTNSYNFPPDARG